MIGKSLIAVLLGGLCFSGVSFADVYELEDDLKIETPHDWICTHMPREEAENITTLFRGFKAYGKKDTCSIRISKLQSEIMGRLLYSSPGQAADLFIEMLKKQQNYIFNIDLINENSLKGFNSTYAAKIKEDTKVIGGIMQK